VDGNFTLWRTNGGSSLHWQGKLRGLEFEALQFRFELTSSPDVLDTQKRQIMLPTMRPTTVQAVEDRREAAGNADLDLLRAMRDAPNASQGAWALATGRSKGRVNGRLKQLASRKLVEELVPGKWTLTTKGKKAALGLQTVEKSTGTLE
jgi:hypothetical protein